MTHELMTFPFHVPLYLCLSRSLPLSLSLSIALYLTLCRHDGSLPPTIIQVFIVTSAVSAASVACSIGIETVAIAIDLMSDTKFRVRLVTLYVTIACCCFARWAASARCASGRRASTPSVAHWLGDDHLDVFATHVQESVRNSHPSRPIACNSRHVEFMLSVQLIPSWYDIDIVI